MPKYLAAGLAAACLGLVVMGPTASGTSGGGTYLTPFREDGATFNPTTGMFSGGHYLNQSTDANGCVANGASVSPSGNSSAYRCVPAAGSMLQLADGRVLFWDAIEGSENVAVGVTDSQGLPVSLVPDLGHLSVNDQARLLTLGSSGPSFAPTTPGDGGAHNTSTAEDLPLPPPLAATHYAYNNGSLFCSDQIFLANGQVLDTGGTDYYTEPTIPGTDKGVVELEGLRNTRIFDPATGAWTQVAPMNHGRWYPSLVTMGNGDIFVGGGVTKLIKPVYPSHPTDSVGNVKFTETFDPTVQPAGKWTDNGTNATRTLPLFPRLHLLPDGHVYYDAAGQAFNPFGYAYDEALWNIAGSYDPATKTWTDLGIPDMTSPFGGFRGSTFSAALELRPDQPGLYSKASYLTAGGVVLPTPGSYVATSNSRIDTVTVGPKGESLGSVGTGAMGRGRWYSAAVPLPDGTIYAVSGADIDEVVTPGLESPIKRAELFTPTVNGTTYTGGSWRDVGDQARNRTYHNTAMLRPDGSVLIAGHAPIPTMYSDTLNVPGTPARPGTNNSHDPSFQVWLPPYFNQPRPVVRGVSAPGNGTLMVSTPDAAQITSVVLIRNTAQTHLVDGDARTVKLPVVSRTGNTVTVALPSSSNVLPNGPYLLFADRGAGGNPNKDIPGQVVPSIGVQVFAVGTSVPQVFPAEVARGALTTSAASASVAGGATPARTGAASAALGGKSVAGTSTAVVGAAPAVRRPAPVLTVAPAVHRTATGAALLRLVATLLAAFVALGLGWSWRHRNV